MSVETTATQLDAAIKVDQTTKPNDKEYNFRALEAKYQRQLEQERAEKERAMRELEEARKVQQMKLNDEEEDDSEPYIDKRRLNKTLSSFEKRFEEKIDQRAEEKARKLFEEEKRNAWLDQNRDFYDVMQHAEKLVQKSPDLAETILKMPEGFERQKLVYANIKALGLDKPEQKTPSIQEKIDSNRRMPYYQPSGIANAPYSQVGDFSPAGQKQSYDKMKQLQSRLTLG
jgi:actin-related protein